MTVYNRVVRLDPTGPELQCPYCMEFWPIDLESWCIDRDGRVRANRCRSCERERARLYQALRRLDPDFNERERKRYRMRVKKQYPRLLEAYDRHERELRAAYVVTWKARKVA